MSDSQKEEIEMERELEFRMEREGLLEPGQEVEMMESSLQTLNGTMYYYTIIPALAMSKNTPVKLKHLKGVVKSVEESESVYTVMVAVKE